MTLEACGARPEGMGLDVAGVDSTCGVSGECSSDFTDERAVLVSGGPDSVKVFRRSSFGCDELENLLSRHSRNVRSTVRINRTRAGSGTISRDIEILFIGGCGIHRSVAEASHRDWENG
jgi:hypothetical protein